MKYVLRRYSSSNRLRRPKVSAFSPHPRSLVSCSEATISYSLLVPVDRLGKDLPRSTLVPRMARLHHDQPQPLVVDFDAPASHKASRMSVN